MLDPDWGSLPDRPSPLAVDKATKHISIEKALSQRVATLADASATHGARIVTSPQRLYQGLRAGEQPTNAGGPSNFFEVAMPPGTKLSSSKYRLEASRDASDMVADQLG